MFARRLVLPVSLLSAVLASSSTGAWADTTDPSCLPARAMVVFDRSTSMIRGTIDGATRWSIATGALKQVVAAYQAKVQFGLTIFPKDPGTCKTGGLAVVDPPALGALPSVTAELADATPGSNDWTPTGQVLHQMASLPSMKDTSVRRFIILVTDGAQSCPIGLNGNPNEASEIWDIPTQVLQVKKLKDLGVTTFVVGFGKSSMNPGDDGVDAYALNQLALAGGTAPSGCDANGTDPTAATNCYYQADNNAELVGALEEIALQVQQRECGVDVGSCEKGTQVCTNGVWGACMGEVAPTTETCDGKDNDCDGVADPSCECVAGDTRPCGGMPKGQCKAGVQTCLPNGVWSSACDGAVGPKSETCDGKDNDCNGVIDNPNPGAVTSAPLCTANQVCQQGVCKVAHDGELAGGSPAGCTIGGGRSAPLGLAALALLLGLVLVRRRG